MRRFVPILLLATACAPLPDPDIVLGTGEIEFEPVADEIEVIRGPQGGFHLLGSMRSAGVNPGNRERLDAPNNPTTTFRVWFGDTQLAPVSAYTQGLDESEAEGFTHEMIGRLVVLDIRDDSELAGEVVTFEVELSSPDGTSITDACLLYTSPSPRDRG